MDNNNYSKNFMGLALQQAQIAFNSDEVPVGAVIVKNGIICGSGFNQVIQKNQLLPMQKSMLLTVLQSILIIID